MQLNIVIESGSSQKYIEPYGNIDCSKIRISTETNDVVQIEKFVDVKMTIESRIMKEIKPNKMNILELERRIQEYMGDSYVRSIFYNLLDSLKERYYIKEVDSIIEYDV